jgi:predicted ArsR family transcriptional regulator
MVQIQTREWKQRKIGEPKKLILQALARSPKTASELSNEMFLSESTVRWHLRRLLKENLIRMISKHGRNSVWGLVENGQVAAA